MKYRKFQKIIRNIVLVALAFVLSTEPVLVAARPSELEIRAETVDRTIAGGDIYLDSASKAVVESMELLGYLNAIQAAPMDQVSEVYVTDVIGRALSVAEECSIALGAVDVVADGIEQLGGTLPAAMNVSEVTGSGLPSEMRDALSGMGIAAQDIDQVGNSAASLLSSRQAGIPSDVQESLLNFGFTQSEIDQISLAISQRGLANETLTTKLDQFRATQDELADTRSGMVILAVQLLGYQIAARQIAGIPSRAITDDELQAIAEDELRLLVHAAHLNAMWGSDPSSEVGEGDWWFIEHYAGRAAERLQKVTIESQNRGLVAELFALHQMKMLAISARTGDAEYAKAELDGLVTLLSHQLDTVTYYQERQNPGFIELAWSRITATPAARKKAEWDIPAGVAKNAIIAQRTRIDAAEVEDLTSSGAFEESNEANNSGGLLIAAGLSFFDQVEASIVEAAVDILSNSVTREALMWIDAILTGDTDNPALLAANMILSLIPIFGVIPDIVTLAVDPDPFVKVLSIIGIIGSIGDIIALIPGLQGVGGASFVGDAVATVVKVLFKQAAPAFRAVLNGMKLADSFDVVIDLVKTVVRIVGDALGSSLDEVIDTIQNIFTGPRGLWGDFVNFVRRVGADTLLKLGFDEGSAIVGRILGLGVELSDEAVVAVKKVAGDLVAAGVELSDEATEGLGRVAKTLNGEDFTQFMNKLGNTCSVGIINSSPKLAIPSKRAGSVCNPELVEKILTSYKRFTPAMGEGYKKIADTIGSENLGEIMLKYASNPDNLTDATKLFGVLGDPAVSKDVISTAFKAGSDLSNKGPEALRALSGWGDFVKNPDLASHLAKRAGKDAVSLDEISKWTSGNIPSDDVLRKIGENSRDGIGNAWGLGKAGDDYNSGFAKFSREKDLQFYYTHPEVSAKVRTLFPGDADAIFWKINETALDGANGPIDKGVNFLFQMTDKNLKDRDAAMSIWSGESEAEIKLALGLQETDNIPFRIKELQLLKLRGYEFNGNITTGDIFFFLPGN